jgi:CheY-like chemotaxis protein
MESAVNVKELILVVDDQPANLKVISGVLNNQYALSVANCGERALKILETLQPGLILLDIMMPGMDGFQVCRILKQNEKTRDIPVIFLSAKTETDDIIKGFEIGAVDYIFKPFNPREIKVRIQNHLNLSNAKRKIAEQNAELEKFKSDLEKTNGELQKSVAEKDKFFSIIAHDLKTPFNGLLGLLQILTEENHKISEISKNEMIETLYQSTKNVYSLIENLLEWSQTQRKIVSFNPKPIHVHEIVTLVKNLLNAKLNLKNIILENNINTSLVIDADEMMLSTIFRNLISNALKYTRRNGIIKVYAQKTDNGYFTFYVQDNGVGMTEETKNKLFRLENHISVPGTENEKGTGLGLLLCKEFVEMHKGKIEVSSEKEIGSTFSFSLPYLSGVKEMQTINDTPYQLKKKLKVLIVEDEVISEEFLTIISFDISSEILKAEDGAEAVRICRENPGIDLIMMDIKMPMMDGYEATTKIREFNKDVIIIAQTAYVLENDREKALSVGCNDYISKPIHKNQFLKIIHKFFN